MTERCTHYQDCLANQPLSELSASELAELEKHLNTCPTCAELRDQLDRDDRRLEGFADSFEDQLANLEGRINHRLVSDVKVVDHQTTGTSFLSRTWVRVALAASLAVVVFFGKGLVMRHDLEGVLWAEVIARVENAQDFICRRIEKRVGEPAQEMVEYRSARFGLRQDIYQNGRLMAEQYIVTRGGG